MKLPDWTLVALCWWNLAVSLDATCFAVALPSIAQELNSNAITAYWTGTAFVLCSATLQPAFASLSDAIGRKASILISLSFFSVGALICGLARKIGALVVGRSVQGVGAGGLTILTYVVLADKFTLAQSSKLQGLVGSMWLIGTVCGPIMGGGFAQTSTWRWIFWLTLVLCGFCYILVAFLMQFPKRSSKPVSARLLEFDWLGCAMFTGFLTSFLIGLSWGGIQYPWSSWHTLVPLLIGAVGLIVWAIYSSFLTSNPMIPMAILNNRTSAITYFNTIIHGLAQFGMLYYLPLYYEAVKLYRPLTTGLALLPQCLTSAPATVVVSILIKKTTHTYPFVLIGWALFALGIGLLQLLDQHTSVPSWIFINIPSGIGLGILFSALVMASQAATETQEKRSAAEMERIKGMAAGLNPFFRTIGQALGIVVGQAAFTNQMRKLLNQQAAQGAAELAQEVRTKLPPERAMLQSTFNKSLHVVWWIIFGIIALAALLSLFTKNVRVHAPAEERPESRLELHVPANATSQQSMDGASMGEASMGEASMGEASMGEASKRSF